LNGHEFTSSSFLLGKEHFWAFDSSHSGLTSSPGELKRAPSRLKNVMTASPRSGRAHALYIDLDILNYFKERASLPGAPPYQTQMNAELRKIMERDRGQDQASGLKEALEQAARSLRKAIKFADEAEVVPKRR
jgi:uncharacterized protein (DUF4415 family)